MVAVKYDEKVTDYAARVFAEQFCEFLGSLVVWTLHKHPLARGTPQPPATTRTRCHDTHVMSHIAPSPPADLSIVTGNTVRNAFRIGVTSIRAESSAAQVLPQLRSCRFS